MKEFLTILLLTTALFSCGQSNEVQTVNGIVKGYTNTDESIQIFKSIPFAAPPVGDLRWQAPQPVEDWKGVRECFDFSASPIQNEPKPFLCWSEEFIAKPTPLNEDCLYLNIWTPKADKESKKPVMVWIYGGGLNSGSANCDIYDGEEMAKQGIVFVSINYRVGVLGFMAHPELSKESPDGVSGNYGILDQIAALKWIKKNIENFGGDPNNVTIAGQSAGAFSVTALIASTKTKGLFHKAIPQSGGILSNRLIDNIAKSEDKGLQFMKLTQCTDISEMRSKSALEIQAMSSKVSFGRFGLTLDDYYLPADIVEHFKNGKHNHVPILTGWVLGDAALFGDPKIKVSEYQEEAKTKYGERSKEFLEIFEANTDDEATKMKSKLALLSFAGLPSHLLAKYTDAPSYVYQFSHVPPDKPDFPNYGAFHTSEVPYTLHTLHTWKRDWKPLDKGLENNISAYWVNFAKTGNPNGNVLPLWQEYDSNSGSIIELGDEIQMKEGLYQQELNFLERNN